jgi:1A family penicillin-binding protein
METILIKIFATALALTQVMTRPDAVKTHFDPAQDQAAVVQLLRDGCTHMRKAFRIENIDLDGLIATAMTDRRMSIGDVKAFRGIKFDDLYIAYRQFCEDEEIANSPIDISAVIAFYNKATAGLPDHTKLKGKRPAGMTIVLDGKGENYAELYEPDSRRIWVPLADIPTEIRAAFIAAEDKRFYQHSGVDERSVVRAFVDSLGSLRRPQGGSTITQQLAKNLLVGDDFTYERKIREIIVASRVERLLSKDEILELYLNTIFLGRSSWGIEMAARSYFGKSANSLSLAEGALIAGLTKGPNAYSPEKHPQRAIERATYVLSRMHEDGVIDGGRMKDALAAFSSVTRYERVRRETGYHFIDEVAREAKTVAGIESLTTSTYTIRTTVRPDLQRATEAALQDGLARYEQNTGRTAFHGAETNLANAVHRLERSGNAEQPAWRRALENARLPLYDVHWTSAIVIDIGRSRESRSIFRVGLKDGTVLPLTASASALRQLRIFDVVYVSVVDVQAMDGARHSVRAELRARPTVQGAAVIIENATGHILAMAGGFSYPLSQLNRATQARRQPGSSLKPLTYLAALAAGLQPNTLVRDAPITLPPIVKSRFGTVYSRDYWRPRNYEGSGSGIMTLRRALEQSKNMVTARLLDGGIVDKPVDSLDRICALAIEAQIYSECMRYYPFVLGAQGVRPLDLAAFYAAIANEGALPTPYAIESIEQDGRKVYQRATQPPKQMTLADRPAFYQLKSILQGVVARGTAASISELSPYVGGKTGTSDEWNDAWFVGFTNDVTIAVWVGYDNADGKRRTLGPRQAGSQVALPIFRSILGAVWEKYAERTQLHGPSLEAQRYLIAMPIDVASGERAYERRPNAFIEHFRTDGSGKVTETQNRLVARTGSDFDEGMLDGRSGFAQKTPFDLFGVFGQIFRPHVTQPLDERAPIRSRRLDPDYFFGNR